MWPFRWRPMSMTFMRFFDLLMVLLIILYKVVLTFESVEEILKCDHSNESYWAVLSCGAVYYAVQGGSNFFESVEEILKCDHSDESYWAVLLFGAVCLLIIFKTKLSISLLFFPIFSAFGSVKIKEADRVTAVESIVFCFVNGTLYQRRNYL